VKQKVAIITDSLACLTPEMVKRYQVRVLPINLYFGDKVYRDGVDITPTEAYKLFQKDPKYFATSAPSPAECFEAYREVSKQSKNILCITVSSKLSMVYESSLIAREEAKTELPGITIEVLNSHTATAAEGFVALAGIRAAAEGKSLAEVTEVTEAIRERVSMIALLDTMRYVHRSGRIPKVASQAASILNIKPLLTISSGLVRFSGAVRSKEHGISQLLRKMRNKVEQNPVHVAVMHAYAEEEAERLKERVSAEFDCAELWLTEFSPVMGYACGTGTLGLAFYSEAQGGFSPENITSGK
jgi:DegV family protein with EDD domain